MLKATSTTAATIPFLDVLALRIDQFFFKQRTPKNMVQYLEQSIAHETKSEFNYIMLTLMLMMPPQQQQYQQLKTKAIKKGNTVQVKLCI